VFGTVWHNPGTDQILLLPRYQSSLQGNTRALVLLTSVAWRQVYVTIYWTLSIAMFLYKTQTLSIREFIRTYSLFKSEHLSTNIKLILYKALIRSIMTNASPTWKFAANTHLLKLQSLQNKVFHTIGNFPRRTPVRELHKAFNIPYIYDKSQQATLRK
jgi:hypothetical protein